MQLKQLHPTKGWPSSQARQVAVSSDSRLLFHPSGSVVQMFRLEDGAPLRVLRGHMETVNCCCYNDLAQVTIKANVDAQGSAVLPQQSCKSPVGW